MSPDAPVRLRSTLQPGDLGTLIRLNEVGLLGKLKRVSSVSGGSITAGVLGMKWKNLKFDATGVAHHGLRK